MIKDSPPTVNQIGECLFDESVCAYSDDGSYELNLTYPGLPDLTADQIEEADYLRRFRDGQTASLMLITGEGGSGKDVTSSMFAWKFKRYYPHCKVLLDFRPRRLMGSYYYFNQDFLVNQVDRMAKIANDECADSKAFNEKTKSWMSTDGEVFLKNSIQVYQEYKKYHYKRRPHNPMGLMLNDQYNIARHLDTLIIGTTVKMNELDTKSCLPHVKFHAKMVKDTKNKHIYICNMNGVKWNEYELSFNRLWSYRFPINAIKDRPELGIKPNDEYIRRQTAIPSSDYYCWYDLYNSKSAIALGVPKSMRKEQ